MTVFCTYCSAEKETSTGPLPALERYRSDRIRRIHQAAQSAGCGFRILSGEYGLIDGQAPIPWYDHLLVADEVPAQAALLAGQLRQARISQLLFFTLPVSVDEKLAPYHEALRRACRETATPLSFVEIDFA
ncbi:MAG: hypothetical protein SF339_27070 [Blastocatellia bacterium]|nr:hypothetical protein [Blastocatellia bacterium]